MKTQLMFHYRSGVPNTPDGAFTTAQSASKGLALWLCRHLPPVPIPPIPEPFVVYQGHSFPGPDDDDFMVLVLAAIERTFGTGPPGIVSVPPRHEDLFETVCLDILLWAGGAWRHREPGSELLARARHPGVG
jgi:hypothetical protein